MMITIKRCFSRFIVTDTETKTVVYADTQLEALEKLKNKLTHKKKKINCSSYCKHYYFAYSDPPDYDDNPRISRSVYKCKVDDKTTKPEWLCEHPESKSA